MDWQDLAACRQRTDIDYFDTDCHLQAALELCAICPVGDRCLNYAIQHGHLDGVWGGAWGEELAGIVSHAYTRRAHATTD